MEQVLDLDQILAQCAPLRLSYLACSQGAALMLVSLEVGGDARGVVRRCSGRTVQSWVH